MKKSNKKITITFELFFKKLIYIKKKVDKEERKRFSCITYTPVLAHVLYNSSIDEKSFFENKINKSLIITIENIKTSLHHYDCEKRTVIL